MAKKNKKTNRELLQEIREEGMFKEASDFTNKKKKLSMQLQMEYKIYSRI